MSGPEIASLIASVVSISLAIGAIALSLVFYFRSSELSERTKAAADRIEQSVEMVRRDSFSMIGDTLADFRRHALSGVGNEVPEQSAAEQIEALKKDFDAQLGEVLTNQQLADSTIEAVRGEVNRLAASSIDASRRVETEARASGLRSFLLALLGSSSPMSETVARAMFDQPSEDSFGRLSSGQEVTFGEFSREFRAMISEGLVDFSEKGYSLSPSGGVLLEELRIKSQAED